MPEDKSPPPTEKHTVRDSERPSSKHRWRGKLFSAEGKFGKNTEEAENTDRDVAKFLHSAVTRPRLHDHSPESSSRFNSDAIAEDATAGGGLGPLDVADVYRRARPRQNKKLRVAFQETVPEIIGEGGDEAELPSKDVSTTAWSISKPKPTDPDLHDNDPQPLRNADPSIVLRHGSSFRASPLPRRPTGLSEIFSDVLETHQLRKGHTAAQNDAGARSNAKNPSPKLPYRISNQCDDAIPDDHKSLHQNVSPAANDELKNLEHAQPRHVVGIEGLRTANAQSSPPLGESAMSAQRSTRSDRLLEPRHGAGELSPMDYDTRVVDLGDPTKRKPVRSIPPTEVQSSNQTAPPADIKKPSLRNIARDLADDALDEFDIRVRRFNDIFRLGVSDYLNVTGLSFARWVQIAAWWFLEGRGGLENEVRRKSGNDPHEEQSPGMKQAYVNLAKACWIVKEITPNHPEIKQFGKASMNSLYALIQSFGDPILVEQADVHASIVSNMRALAISMKRNHKLPSPDLEIQRLDLQIVLQNQPLPSGLKELLINNTTKSFGKEEQKVSRPFFPTPISDTHRHFNFSRMFVDVSVMWVSNMDLQVRVPCMISVLRDRTELGVKVSIASQGGEINLVVSDEDQGGLPWRSVQWKISSHEMLIRRTGDLTLLIKLTERDFKTLWGICDYTHTIRKGFSVRKNESLVFERMLKEFQCENAPSFPPEPMSGCSLRLFEKEREVSEGSNHRKVHDGYRIAVITPPGIKALSSFNQSCGREYPILYAAQKSGGNYILCLRLLPSTYRLDLNFHDMGDLDRIRDLLSGTPTEKDEYLCPSQPLQRFLITSIPEDQGEKQIPAIQELPWRRVQLIGRRTPPDEHHEQLRTHSRNLRILADSDLGTLTDRVNLEPGELQIGLDVDDLTQISILRPPQSDMTWSLADGAVKQEYLDSIRRALDAMLVSRTIRTYLFRSMEDMHCFQAIVTGYTILFDGIVDSFAISRRRTVVPMHKRWEALSPRIQIIKREKTCQLVAFFRDFSHGACMNFVLKMTDAFENFSKSGKFCIRLVDAKFALPKNGEDDTKSFVSFDTPEYPSEHDDVMVAFNDEHDRDRFGETLPAPISKMSRMASLKR